MTIHRGTAGGGGVTEIGDHNVFMAYAHVAHDCHVGNDTIFGNARDARRPRDGRGLRERSAPSQACTSSAASAARVHRRLLGGHQGRAAVCEDRRQPRAHLRPEHHRPGAPRSSRRTRSPSCAARTATCCTRTPAARSRRSSATRRSHCDEVQYVVDFIRTSSRGVGLRRPSRRLEEVVDE